jgi:hypothetical protein
VELRHGRYQDVMRDVTCDLLCVDAPYSERTHGAYRAQEELRRRAISYAPWTRDDVRGFVDFWVPRTRGWFATLTDSVLTREWEAALEDAGLYTFSPIACMEPGSRVRMNGDGPTQWSVNLVVARPKRVPYSKWGALPGGYVVPAGCGRKRSSELRIGGKPLWLMREIVKDYSREGDVVCDPCAGGAVTLLAARLEKRIGIGSEQDAAAYAQAMEVLTHGYGRAPEQEALPL